MRDKTIPLCIDCIHFHYNSNLPHCCKNPRRTIEYSPVDGEEIPLLILFCKDERSTMADYRACGYKGKHFKWNASTEDNRQNRSNDG